MLQLILQTFAQAVPLKDQFAFGTVETLGEAITHLLAPGFSIAGVAVLIYFAIGAVRLITSGGDKNTVASARGQITHAIIGFLLLMMILIIVQFVFQFFGFSGFDIIE